MEEKWYTTTIQKSLSENMWTSIKTEIAINAELNLGQTETMTNKNRVNGPNRSKDQNTICTFTENIMYLKKNSYITLVNPKLLRLSGMNINLISV